jgi:hypothetical protein
LTFPAQHVVSFITALWRIALPVVVVPRADSIIELIGDCLSSLSGQAFMPFAVPPLHGRFAEPVVLPTDCSPVPLAAPIPQVRRAAGQPLQLIGALNVELTGQIHPQTEKPSRLSTGGTGLKAKGPTADYPRGQPDKIVLYKIVL